MEPIATIVLVMLVAGILGGLMNFFISTQEKSSTMPWWQHMVLGIGASFMVPLFLNMISSGLIKEIIGASSTAPGDGSKLFVLAGFSLVAAVSSRAFIRSLTAKVLQDVKEAKLEAEKATSVAHEAKSQASTALNVLDENEASDAEEPQTLKAEVKPTLTTNELRIITEMTTGRYSMRSISGLAKDTSLEKDAVNAAISSLMEKGLIEQGTNSRGETRWYPSPPGRVIATRINQATGGSP